MTFRYLCLPFLSLALAVGLSSCAGVATQTQPSSTSVGPVSWPHKDFTNVKAFTYDCDADESRDFILPDGRFSKGILAPGGVSLSQEQTKRLMAAITIPQPKSQRTPCYVPHHAFVFYNAEGQPIAHLEICFTCNKFRAFPGGLPEYVDMKALYALVGELGIPLGSGKEYYRNLYKQAHPGAP